ncbi:hypothetical protein BX666DRAFT_1999786 [Dichotomocladium elegans]|nr:hypothetical protein BX666DRAFT_1999786 [Dichotomocladium elegans]
MEDAVMMLLWLSICACICKSHFDTVCKQQLIFSHAISAVQEKKNRTGECCTTEQPAFFCVVNRSTKDGPSAFAHTLHIFNVTCSFQLTVIIAYQWHQSCHCYFKMSQLL